MAAGLILGGVMQPHLFEGDRPSGPQMFAGWAGVRSTGPFDPGTSFASFTGPIPDYVVGTDWKKTMAWPSEPAAVSPPEPELARADAPSVDEPAALTRAAYEDPPPPPHDYPSLGGAATAAAATDAAVDASAETAPAVQG